MTYCGQGAMSGRERSGTRQYPIRVVARMTGLTIDTLRAWERRYQAVVPARAAVAASTQTSRWLG